MHEHWSHLLLVGILHYLCENVAGRVVLLSSEENCELWTPKDFKNLRENGEVTLGSASSIVPYSQVQFGVYVTHTPWINFEGCTLHSHNGSCRHKLSGERDPIVECYEHCNKSTFSTFHGCCYCSGNKHSNNFCPGKPCFSNFSGLCGEFFNDNNSGCFCQYRPTSITVQNGYSNCLKLYHEREQIILLESEQCNVNLKYFGVSQKDYKKANWWEAALQVTKDFKQFANDTFLKNQISLAPMSYYWVGTFRKPILVKQRPNKTENYCGTILKTGDGKIRFKMKACNSTSLQKLCVTTDESSRGPRATTTTKSPINTTRSTDACMLTTSNNCTDIIHVSTDQADGLGKNGVIVITVIVVIIILVMISFGIFFKTRRTAKSPSMMSDVSGSTDYISAPRNEYISQSSMNGHGAETSPNENGYSEVRIEDEIEVANAEVQINTAQNRLRNSKNNDQYDSFSNVKKSAVEQSDISNSNYEHVQRNVNVGEYDVFERNNDVTMSDYDEMDKMLNNDYDTFKKKTDADTGVNSDYDHVDTMKENE